MRLEPDKKVTIVVTHSKCKRVSVGDTVYLDGPFIDNKRSSSVCLTALLGIYPWIMTSRFGISSEDLGWDNGYRIWCPERLVEFTISMGKTDQTENL